MDKETPEQNHTGIEKDGITFFIDNRDTWYFDDKDLAIEFNEQLGEPEFRQIM